MEDPAGFDDARVDNVVVSVEPVAPDGHQARVAQERQMLGDVRFRDAELADKSFHRHFLLAQKIQNFQTLGISENFIGYRVSLIGRSGKRSFDFPVHTLNSKLVSRNCN